MFLMQPSPFDTQSGNYSMCQTKLHKDTNCSMIYVIVFSDLNFLLVIALCPLLMMFYDHFMIHNKHYSGCISFHSGPNALG